MEDDARTQFLREARREEAMALFDKAKSYAARNDQLIALGAALIAAIAGLGLKENAEQVLLGVPTAVSLLVIYSAQVDSDVRVMGAARQRIEVILEAELGASALIYYSCAAAPDGLHRSTRAAVGAGLVLGVGASVAGFVVALGISTVAACLYSVVTLIMAGAAVAVVRGMLETERDAKARVAQWPRTREP